MLYLISVVVYYSVVIIHHILFSKFHVNGYSQSLLFLPQCCMNGGRSEREGDTESEAGSRLCAVSTEPDAGLELTDREIMT